MKDDQVAAAISQALEESWEPVAGEAGYVQRLRAAAGAPGLWARLPGLCCAAAGGAEADAARLAAAWMLSYRAAGIMDHVQDGDPPDAWWEQLGPGVALNAAVGLFFGAMRLLNSLAAPHAAQAIRAVFTQTYMVMSAGQQRDLAGERLDLGAFWEVAQAKSGVFFGLACWSGARLATDDPERLAALQEFGEILGVLIQIGDEQADALALNNGALIEPRTRRILPVVYALEVASADRRVQIEDLLVAGAGQKDATQTLYHIVEQEGAGLYMAVERERRRAAALAALNRSRPDPPAAQQLAEFVQRLVD